MVNYLDNAGWTGAYEGYAIGSALSNLLCCWHLDKYVCSHVYMLAKMSKAMLVLLFMAKQHLFKGWYT